jgi:hypothetical protein
VQAVFYEPLASPKLAETLAREVGARTLVLNPSRDSPPRRPRPARTISRSCARTSRVSAPGSAVASMGRGAPRICLVTCLAWPDISASDVFAARALERGAPTSPVSRGTWRAPASTASTRWCCARAGTTITIRTPTWPGSRAGKRRRWASGTRRRSFRWNISKAYLLDLEGAGVPVVPTLILDDEAARLPAIMAERRWDLGVVKPLFRPRRTIRRSCPRARRPQWRARSARAASAGP